MPLWLLHLTEGVGRCMMGQALEQWLKQSTNKGPRSSKGRYIMRETLQGKEKRNPMERILQHEKLKTVIKSWKDIFKNYSSWTLPMRDFFAKDFLSFVFLCFLIIFGLLQALSNPWKPSFQPTFQKFIVLGSLGLSPSLVWAQEPKPALTLSF